MRICRFDDNRVGIVSGEGIRDVTGVLDRLPQVTYPLPRHDPFIAALRDLLPELLAAARRASPIPVDQVRLLSPVANTGKIIAAPVNYKKHLEEALADKGIHHGNLIQEIHKAGMFLKATSALVGAGQGVTLVHTDRRNDHEVELALVIGKTAKNVKEAQTSDLILSVAELIEWGSAFYTLYPGDVILIVTPQGVGPLFPCDTRWGT